MSGLRVFNKAALISAMLAPAAVPVMAAGPVGYATVNGGITGGQGGQIVYATTGTEINQAMCERASEETPLIIYVSGTINHDNTDKVSGACDTAGDEIQFKRVSNISLIGTAEGALFDEIGIHLREASNIIIRNVHVRNVKKSGSPTSNGGDAIGMEKDVHNVWIDHNELEASGGEKAGYDSLIDIKNNSKYVTVSYNYLHNSGRGGLINSSDSNVESTYVTFHHNIYDTIDSRMPLLRAGTAHSFNNYYFKVSKSGINSRLGASIKAENNYFEQVQNAIGTFYTDDMGYWEVSGNIYDDVEWVDNSTNHPAGSDDQLPVSNTTVTLPYDYELDDASCLKTILAATVGPHTNLAESDGSCSVDGGQTPAPDPQPEPELPPVSVSASVDGNAVTLSWNEAEGATGYQVYLDSDSDPKGRVRQAVLDPQTTSYTLSDLASGQTYWFWIKYSAANGATVSSDAVSATPLADGVNVILSAVATEDGVVLNWNASETGSGYQIYMDTDSDPSGRVRQASVGPAVTQYTLSGLEAGQTYWFWVKYLLSDGTYGNSAAASVTVAGDAQTPDPATYLSVSAGSDGSGKGHGSYGDVRDGDLSSYWSPNGDSGRISLKWDGEATLNAVIIREAAGYEGNIQAWTISDHKTGEVLAEGNGVPDMMTLDTVSLRKLDFNILSASGSPAVAEFEAYYIH